MTLPERSATPFVPQLQLRDELLYRRARLDAARAAGAPIAIEPLLAQVDEALSRIDAGTFGLCEVCHDPIEADRLVADPLTRFCLDHLTAEQRLHLERDLELATEIQSALLPPRDIVAAGWHVHYVYRPAGTVSGDYCDVIDPSPAGLRLVLGDVSGKGIAASILMSNLHALFRSIAASQVPCHDTVSRVNRIFCTSTLPWSFATLVFARLDASGEVDVCNAGHCPPLIVRSREIQRIQPTGAAVGLNSDMPFETATHHLDAGDLLVLYTDGITETFDASGDEYGAERLGRCLQEGRALAPADLTRACLTEVSAFGGRGPQRDDVSLMVVRRL
jgi:sigma-B regulation protein RsbU (phosphoserine phosphatase)